MEQLLAYEFYYRDPSNHTQLIGILPERRKDPQRITPDSIYHWAQTVLGSGWDMERVNVVEVMIDKQTGVIQESYKKHPF